MLTDNQRTILVALVGVIGGGLAGYLLLSILFYLL